MNTAIRTQTLDSVTQKREEPKRLSKVGQWMKDNPNGIFIVTDRRAVNR
jgi:hypothetical protein